GPTRPRRADRGSGGRSGATRDPRGAPWRTGVRSAGRTRGRTRGSVPAVPARRRSSPHRHRRHAPRCRARVRGGADAAGAPAGAVGVGGGGVGGLGVPCGGVPVVAAGEAEGAQPRRETRGPLPVLGVLPKLVGAHLVEELVEGGLRAGDRPWAPVLVDERGGAQRAVAVALTRAVEASRMDTEEGARLLGPPPPGVADGRRTPH